MEIFIKGVTVRYSEFIISLSILTDRFNMN